MKREREIELMIGGQNDQGFFGGKEKRIIQSFRNS